MTSAPLWNPIAAVDGDGPFLHASRCAACGRLFFPRRESCESCGHATLTTETLPRSGKLWTWTSQAFPPPSPPYFRSESRQSFAPYFTGYVQLGDVLVLARIAASADREPSIGDVLKLSLQSLPGAYDSLPQVPVFELAS